MAGDVHERVVLVQDLGAESIERVDHPADRALVAGDHARRDDHEVAPLDPHVLVLVGGHQRQRRVRLALASRRKNHLTLGGKLAEILELHQDVLGHTEVAHVGGDRHISLHAHPQQRDSPARASGEREHLLDAMDVRGEGGDDDPPGGGVEARAERLAHVHLRARVTGPVHVRGVRAEDHHTLLAQLGEAPIVRRLAVQWARVELEVTRVDDGADGRVDRQTDAIHDRVRHADRLDAE